MPGQFISWYQLKIVTLTPRQNRVRQFMRFGGRQHKRHVWRRLFQRLEQRIKRLGREHVNFVDDVNLFAQHRRLVTHRFGQFTDCINATIARAVHLDVIDRRTSSDTRARATSATRLRGRAIFTVERFANNASQRGFAAAARAAKQKRVVDPTAGKCIAQRPRDVLLTHDFRERRRSILTR